MIQIKHAVLGPVQTNVYFLIDEASKSCVLVDPGDRADLISQALQKEGLTLAGILLTHGHYDHIGAVAQLRTSQDGSVPVYALEAERRLLEDARINMSAYTGRPANVTADVWLQDGDEFDLPGMHIKVIATPGHTAGGCCYYLEDEKMLFSGDTLFCGDLGRSDLPTGDGEQLVRSIREKLLPLPDDTLVFPGHDEMTSIGQERKYNPYLS